MADAVLPAFLQVLFQNAMELLKKKLEFACDIDNEGQKLMSNMEMIQAVLRGGEKMKFNDEQRLWFSDLKDAGYDAMDVLDEYLYEVQRRKRSMIKQINNMKEVCVTGVPLFLQFHPVVERMIRRGL
jgi:hypothetical protein